MTSNIKEHISSHLGILRFQIDLSAMLTDDEDETVNIPSPTVSIVLPSNSSPVKRQIFLYALRTNDPNEKCKIKGTFDSDVKFTFDRCEAFDETDKRSPCIHVAKIDVELEGKTRCFTFNETGRRAINGFRLRLVRKVLRVDRDYNDTRERFLGQPDIKFDHFLFDIFFERHSLDSPPGQNVSFWNQLCLYTYYLLHHRQHVLSDTLNEQFFDLVHREQRILTRIDLNEFFQCCLDYSPYTLSKNPDAHRADLIIFSMIGSLNVTSTNLDPEYQAVRIFSKRLIEDMKQHEEKIFQLVSDENWPNFSNGLAICLSVQLVTDPTESIQIVEKISNEKRRRDLATLLIKRLEQLNRPVISADWTKIFQFLDPQIITLRQFELTRSIEVYLYSLIVVLQQKPTTRDFTDDELVVRFDQLIYQDRLIGKTIRNTRRIDIVREI